MFRSVLSPVVYVFYPRFGFDESAGSMGRAFLLL